MAASQTTLTIDETGPKTSWDPKKYICAHNAERPILAEKISTLSKKLEDLNQKHRASEKKLEDIELFYEKFGDEYSENNITFKIQDYVFRKWDRHSELEEEIKEMEEELLKFRKLLRSNEDNAKELNCPCLIIEF